MKRLLLSCIGFCAMFMANALTPDSAQMAIDTFALHPDMQHASMTIAVADIKTGKIIASHNPDLSCITASTMKTVTSATALELLGGDYRFKTRVYAQGEIKGNRLKGNLLILGCGDPTLGSVYFPKNANIVQEILLALQERGIKKIDGRIIVDQSIIPYPAYNGWWDVGDLAWDYGMGIHGLSYSDNRTHLKFNALNGKIDSVMLEPPVPGLAVINRMSSENRDNVNIGLEYATPAAVLMGSAANQHYDFTIANPLPANMLVDSLQRVLKNNKIKVKNKDVKHIAPTSTLIAEHLSEPLCDIVRSLLDRSD
ncbi:MAG: D-alanyl-D-alanine carboxypeptidase/D-alanyl-D-alanine-endopeptidase, partial [Muribaculaceae bacterium]|nr:D-alanyl-D-alanine carboxypeptidase/D-alanyl-D-alanine-endopeptidase [Muribaculaceae bacterium]